MSTREFGRGITFQGPLTPELEAALRADADRCIRSWGIEPIEPIAIVIADEPERTHAMWVATCAA